MNRRPASISQVTREGPSLLTSSPQRAPEALNETCAGDQPPDFSPSKIGVPPRRPRSGARCPVRGDEYTEVVFAPHLGIGDRLPQALGVVLI